MRAARGAAMGLAAGLLFRDLGLHAAISYSGSKLVLVVVIAAAASLVGMTRLRLAVPLALGALAALWLAVAVTPLTPALVQGLVRRDPPVAGDAVYVAAAAVQDDGDLNSVGLARIIHGITLSRSGLAPRLVISDIADRPSHAPAVRRLLHGLALDTELIVVGPSANTHDEAVATARLFKERGWKRVVVVTSPLHSRRAAATFEAQGLEVVSAPALEADFDLEALTSPDDHVRAFGPALHERIGLLVYGWRGWIAPRKN